MVSRGAKDSEFARELWIMCSRDILFWYGTFAWTYDPRKEPGVVPMIPWGFQEKAIHKIDECVGTEDLLIEKSRDMGASWIILGGYTYRWQFRKSQSFLMVSRNEDYVDKAGNPKSLFWKVDFLLKHQPGWLLPRFRRTKLHLANLDNGSVIDGESTTGDVGRGDRRTGIMLDEFAAFAPEDGYKALAATGDTTNSRVFNSTPQGASGAFYDMAQSGIQKLRMHWTEHPEKAAGLWYDDEGKPRSPWYDRECLRRPIPMLIAQELDIDYLGSSYQFFDSEVLTRIENEDVRPPYWRGEIVFDMATVRNQSLSESEEGRLHLWMLPDARGEAPRDRKYVVAADVATGTGSSNSVISVGDTKTGEKIAEFASSAIKPHELAKVAVALARFFNGAFLIWEANGPGRIFGDQVVDLGYSAIYYRENDRSVSKKSSDVPGWYSTRENKLSLLGEYRRALGAKEFINRSRPAIRECREYVFLPTGAVEHSKSVNTIDPTGARDNHGDRAIADALLHKGMKALPNVTEPEDEAPAGSFMWRRQQRREKLREKAAATYW
jgi:hypothetical protein